MSTLFSVRNHNALRALFEHLRVPFSETDPVANAALAERLWVTEHRQINTVYSDEQLLGVLGFAGQMNMLGESLPVDFAEKLRLVRTNNPGGTRRAMIKRFRLLERLEREGHDLGVFLCWAGQRLRDLATGETLDELIEFMREENPWILLHPWVLKQLVLNDNNPDRYMRPFATETDVMILCALVVYGYALEQRHIEPIFGEQSSIEGVPGRFIRYYVFTRPGGSQVIVHNGAAVARFNGKGEPIEPRPTLSSTAAEIRELFGFDGEQGFMASNPHTWRLRIEAERIAGTSFKVFGLPAPEANDLKAQLRLANTVLGEVARTLHQEVKHQLV